MLRTQQQYFMWLYLVISVLSLPALGITYTDRCDLELDPGQCPNNYPPSFTVPHYYYDRSSSQCVVFTRGQCGGNMNDFYTKEACESRCVNRGSACNLAAEVGRCRAAMPRYFFNMQTMKCDQFRYGGCGGNANNYYSLEECRFVCA